MKYTKFSGMGKSAYRVWAANMVDYEDMTPAEGGTIIKKLSAQQRTQLHDLGQCELSDAQTEKVSIMLAARSLPEQLLIQQSIEKGTHYGYVKGKTYYTESGSKIVFGDYIILHSMGTPANMLFPLKLVSARNYYSTVGYNNNVEVVVTDAKGVRYTLRDAHLYSPRKGEGKFTTPAVPDARSWGVTNRKQTTENPPGERFKTRPRIILPGTKGGKPLYANFTTSTDVSYEGRMYKEKYRYRYGSLQGAEDDSVQLSMGAHTILIDFGEDAGISRYGVFCSGDPIPFTRIHPPTPHTATTPDMPALIDENVALHASERRGELRREARWQAEQKTAASTPPAAAPKPKRKKAAKPKVKDKVKLLGKWGHIIEVRVDDVRIKPDGIGDAAVLIYIDMLHKVPYKPDPIAKMSFYWQVKPRTAAPSMPPILTAPPELAADVLGGGVGLPPTQAAPKRKKQPKKAGQTTKRGITLIEQRTQGEDSYYGAETKTGKTHKNLTLAQAQKVIRNKSNPYIEYDIYVGGKRVMLWSEEGRPFRVGHPHEKKPTATPKETEPTQKELLARAEELGREGFFAGKQAPAQDAKLLDMCSNRRHSQMMALMTAWSKGWHAEHRVKTDEELRKKGIITPRMEAAAKHRQPQPKPTPTPSVPPILAAPPELAADVLGGGTGLTPTQAPKPKAKKTATRTAKKPPKKTTAAKTKKTTKTTAAKPKTKKTAATTKLTPSQRAYLAINGFVMVKRGGKYVKITN